MTSPSNVVPLDQPRQIHRAGRALDFVVRLLAGGRTDDLAGLGLPFAHLKHLPDLGMDIAVTRDPGPTHMKEILAFARRRQMGFILVRFRDPAPTLAEFVGVDVVLFDTGLAVLEDLEPATDGRRWVLVGQDLHLRIGRNGLVPTLKDPWPRDEDRYSCILKARRIFGDYVWG